MGRSLGLGQREPESPPKWQMKSIIVIAVIMMIIIIMLIMMMSQRGRGSKRNSGPFVFTSIA